MKTAFHRKEDIISASIILIIMLGFTVYSNSLNGEFICDDYYHVKDNVHIKDWTKLPNIFTESIGAGGALKSNFYRPVQALTYMIDYHLWKLNVYGYHITNILLHILVALGIYWLINILYDNNLLSLFTSALFIIHPIHTEAVAHISGRADSIVAVFILLSLILYIKGLSSRSINIYLFMLFSYILALLSKENSLIFPLLLLLYHYAFKKKFRIKRFLPILGITFIYILLRITSLKASLPNTWYVTSSVLQRIPGFFVAITEYLKLLLLPFNLHMEYGNRLFNLNCPKAILGILIVLFLLAYVVRVKNRNSLTFFSICWFFLTLLPQSNLYPMIAYMAEHWLYLPSIGFFLIIASLLKKLYDFKTFKSIVLIFIIGVLGFYSHLTIKQNNYWKDAIVFNKRTLKYTKKNFRVYNNLGLSYLRIDKIEEAIALFKKAIEANPNYPYAYNNLGVAYLKINKKEEAAIWFEKTIEIDPGYPQAYNNLALIYYYNKKYDLAIKYCDKAIKLGFNVDPGFLKLLEPYRNR